MINAPAATPIPLETKISAPNEAPTSNPINEKIVVPQLNVSGKTFKGWYWKDGETEVGFNGIMPPFTLNLYAKWE